MASLKPPKSAKPIKPVPLATVAETDGNRRADLIRVSARLFREKGFDGTTILDVVRLYCIKNILFLLNIVLLNPFFLADRTFLGAHQ
jgi:hypothetical protein